MPTPSPSDQRLFEGIRFGNEADFECFFRRYYPRLVNYAARFVAGHETARDLVQDSFARLWERRCELRELDLASLLFTMVRNACLNYLKHNGVVARHELEYTARMQGEERIYSYDFLSDAEQPCLYEELQRELFRFVTSDAACRRQFAAWRLEWEAMPASDAATDRDWRRLRSRIRLQGSARSARPGRFAAVWRAAAAVAVVCATFFGARLYDRLLLERATERYTVTTKSGDRSTVCLPDGTQVRLNGSSTLTYPANFNATNRSVELSGAAYFDVSPDEKHRFEVKVGNCSVVVKGTKFDVTAYPDDSLITTTLLEGAVGFTAPRGETLLRPGESLTYDRFAETTAITHVNTAQYLAWIEGRIEFIDVTIVQLCESLSSLYGVEITLDDRLRADGTFITIRLSNQESLDSVLKALDLIVPVSVHRQGPSVRLSAK